MSDRTGGHERGPRRDDATPRQPSAGVYAGAGLQFALSILLFLFAGQWLDRRLGTGPWLTLLGVLLGASGGFYSLYRKLTAWQREEDR